MAAPDFDHPDAVRLRAALDLCDFADRMFRQRLRRNHPELSAEEIEDRVRRWYERRPGAEHGDGEGTPVELPRKTRG